MVEAAQQQRSTARRRRFQFCIVDSFCRFWHFTSSFSLSLSPSVLAAFRFRFVLIRCFCLFAVAEAATEAAAELCCCYPFFVLYSAVACENVGEGASVCV